MESVEAFAASARGFQTWLLEQQHSNRDDLTETLRRLLTLYSAALSLPDDLESSEPLVSPGSMGDASIPDLRNRLSELPVQYYGDVFDPLQVPPEEAGLGDLHDDMQAIFQDVVAGLDLYDSGDIADAVWHWKYNFRTHWGRHAVSAIRVLHCYLAELWPER